MATPHAPAARSMTHPPPPPPPAESTLDLGDPVHEHRQVFSGQLSKFTNVMKGWQFRWFVLEPETGTLEYYIPEERNTGKCRGRQHLGEAEVLPSVEDEHTFNVNFKTGDVYKLRSADAKERQRWVDRIRAVIQMHNQAHQALSRPALPIREPLPATPPGSKSHINDGEPSLSLQNLSLTVLDAFASVHHMIHQADFKRQALCQAIEALPSAQGTVGPQSLDEDLLILKATAAASFMAMQQSLTILQGCMDARQSQPLAAATPHISKSILSSPKTTSRSQFFMPSPTKSKSGLAKDGSLSTSTSSLPAATLSEATCHASS
ncbi:hypothetical protein TCAL_11946 [Tigriopus californicus]|uniref:PH domain-containing protein n=1 Tax=Tigriopus californicus TaxID=6832 RepID=A0A553P1F2_TIGCA|nr:oxysterol-binding protein-related protein 11-like [Tigriopus californicus]TRY71524.1 hypothetical protein TCAL_11946 [Tigriopus californicus]|eukprot:TCALIF_11946-PA protein Name:"Similar to OSBPL11 Oxysterol-binding protein-related protein 11 (Homo sapiens)" AED:0.12 eAED:0.14 QI:0/-1/0/1/-1/1/1/0/319